MIRPLPVWQLFAQKKPMLQLLIVFGFMLAFISAAAQQEIELNATSYSGAIPNGPVITNQTASFNQNTTGSTFVSLQNPVNVTASFSNQQFTSVAGAPAGMMFGGTLVGATNSNVVPNPVFTLLNSKGSPASSSYTSNPDGTAGTGINVAQNYGFEVFNTINMWFGTSGPAGRRAYYGDITFTFSRPVSDPVIHFADLGATHSSSGNGSSTEYELPAGSTVTLTKLSGTTQLSVPVTADKILNTAANPSAGCGSGGAACGSVRINGINITSVTFHVYLRFRNSSFSSVGSDVSGDAIIISFSFPAFNLSGNVYNDADGIADNTVDGPVTNATNQLYALAVDAFGKIQGSNAVSAAGTFSFTNLVKGPYTVRLSTSPGSLGASAGSPALPSGWINTGEYFGTGSGHDTNTDGNLDGSISNTDIANFNFGIERIPTANDIFYQLAETPVINSSLPLNGAIGILPLGNTPIMPNGNDIEDGILSTGNTIVIQALPAKGILKYNNVAITPGQIISNFVPALLTVQFTGTGYNSISFTYSYKDAASMTSVPAIYTLAWDAMLPVTLISFEAAKHPNNDVLLKWTTATEYDNHGFGIQHSANGVQWETIGFVNAGTNQNTTYTFLHEKNLPGHHYYRLQQFDIDGRYTYSPVRKISIEEKGLVKIYPNPASDNISVTWGNKQLHQAEAQLYTANGQMAQQPKLLVNGGLMNVAQLKSGIYYLVIYDPNNGQQIYTGKVFKL